MQLSSVQKQKISELTQEFFEHVLYDEDPVFISDEATIWDVSMSTGEELIGRISQPEDQRQRHHRKPRFEGGGGVVDNGVVLCPSCHKERHRILREERKTRRN